jgi:DNA-binding transcriptional MocR family regulator
MSTGTIIGAKRLASIIGTGPWPRPGYESVATAISSAITDGRLASGVRLPSERELAKATGLSRTTTARAYALLREREYVATRRGSGSIVRLPQVPGGKVDHLLTQDGAEETDIDLRCTAQTAPPAVMRAYEAGLGHLGAYLPAQGLYPSGIPVLRELIAARYADRGVATEPDQILITSGALGSVAIAVRALLRDQESSGDGVTSRGRGRVLIERPSYPNAIASLEAAGARLVNYPLEHGPGGHHWDIDAMDEVIASSGARIAYLIPDFHNPTGALLPGDERSRLGEVLRRRSVVPIIDESLVELELEGTETPAPLAAHVPDSITVGSTSKIFWAGLRIGWLRVPSHRIDQIASARLSLDLGAPVLEQLAAAELMADHDAVVAETRSRLRRGRDLLVAQVRTHLPDWEFTVPRGGMSLWARLPNARSSALAAAAKEHGLGLVSGPNFAPGGGLNGWIRLPFTASEDQLAQVGGLLAAAWKDAQSMPIGRAAPSARIVA